MTTATIALYHFVQNVQLVGVKHDQMRSVAHFSVQVNGKVYHSCTCEISQPPGTEQSEEIECGPPEGGYPADKPWNTVQFNEKVGEIYKRRVPNIKGTNIMMTNNRIGVDEIFEIELPD